MFFSLFCVCCNSNKSCWIFHVCHCFETVPVCDVRCNKGGMREFCQCCLHKSSPLHFSFFSFFLFFMHKSVQATLFVFLRCKAMRLSSSACAYCNKATWWFWFSEKITGLLCFIGTQRAECVRLRRERVSRGERRNECHACVGSGFGRVWNNDLNMCYSWESSERKVQTKALAVQPCRGHRWRNHKDCETLAVEKSFVKKKKKKFF